MNADLKDKFLIILEFYLPYLACKDFGDFGDFGERPSMCLNIKKHQISCLSFSFNKKKINIFSAPKSFRSCKSLIFFIS